MSQPSADAADKADGQDRMNLTACPKCSKPLSEFSRIYNLLYHIDHCEATEPWVNRAELEACPKCSMPCTEFTLAPAFYNHMKNCKATEPWKPDLRKKLTACPKCSKPRSEFTESFGFNQHMEFCQATEPWKPDPRKDLKVCPRCSKPADRFSRRSGFNAHISQCKATKQWVDDSPAEPSTQPAETSTQPAEQQPLPAKKSRRPAPKKPQLREITEDLEECPSCYKSASSFRRRDLFEKHARACDEPPGDRSYMLLVDLEECPQCLKPKTAFGINPSNFYHHVIYCNSAPDHDAEVNMLNALTECPSCLRKAEEFYHSGAFRAHVRKCEMSPDQVSWSKKMFTMEECPWCFRPSAAWTQRSAFYEHIRKCAAAPDQNSSDMGHWTECSRCHQPASEFQDRADFYQHILDCVSSEKEFFSDDWQSLFSRSEDELLHSSNAVLREELVWDILTGASCTTELALPSHKVETSRESCFSVDEHVKQEQLVWDLAIPMAPAFSEPLEAGLHGSDDPSSWTDDIEARLEEKRDSHLCEATLTCAERSPCPLHHRQVQIISDELLVAEASAKERDGKRSALERTGFGAGVRSPVEMQALIRNGVPIPRAFNRDFQLLRQAFSSPTSNHFFQDTEFAIKSPEKSSDGIVETWPFDITVARAFGDPIYSGRVDYQMRIKDLKAHFQDHFICSATISKVYKWSSVFTWGETRSEIATILHEGGVSDTSAHT